MDYQFYMHFESEILYIKSGMGNIPDGFANFCFKKSFIPKLQFLYSIDTCIKYQNSLLELVHCLVSS